MPDMPASPTTIRDFLRQLERREFTSISPIVEQHLVALLQLPNVKYQRIVNPALSLLRLDADIAVALERASASHGGLTDAEVQRALPALDRPLVHALLRRTILGDIGVELLLNPVRHFLLRKYTDNGSGAIRPWLKTVVSLACQLSNNEYVYWYSDWELSRVEQLARAMKLGEIADAELEIASCVLAMYVDVASVVEQCVHPDAVIAALPEEMVVQVRNAALERQFAAEIPTVGVSADEVSHAVREQYEQFPYPRWISMDFGPARELGEAVSRWIGAPFEARRNAGHKLRAFVPGCGTGIHPLALANALRNCDVLAMDLSRASLAYAMRKSREYGMTNVRFVHGDLLSLDPQEHHFDVIEVDGVLHHMRDVKAALKRMADFLEPGGLMEVGIYSRQRTQRMGAARRLRETFGSGKSAATLREFRRKAVQEFLGTSEAPFLEYNDFHTLSGVRDLLFHAHETMFSLEEIKAMLDDAGLRFVGFTNVPKRIREEFDSKYPGSREDLQAWIRFAGHAPMFYSFWVEKP
jgi:ubiquinone/menaquinone biosynthesis C-methylase UbiE